MKYLGNKGQVATGLNFLLKLMLFIVITGSAVYLFNNVALSDIKAQNAVRDLGANFDVLAISPREIELEADCPADVAFTIDGPTITAEVKSFIGSGFASYSYLHESNAVLPDAKAIGCSSFGKVTISKTYDSSLNPVITIQ